jgi:glycosyltransferase involved in cell wall biosynthesis
MATDCFAAADVVVIPYDRITTSAVLRHAWSAGRPVIATRVGELERHVVPGETGWLVPPAEVGALASALIDALGDRQRCQRMGERGREYATAAFDWDAIAVAVFAALQLPAGTSR